MRWDRLFEDLEAQFERLAVADRTAEVVEATRAERGQVHLADRLLRAVGSPLRLRVRGLGRIEVVLVDLGADWVLLEVQAQGAGRGRQLLVPTAAIMSVEGLGLAADPRESAASRRFGLRHALRGISRDRAVVRVHDIDGEHSTGTIDRVLADHVDLMVHADDGPRRVGVTRGSLSIPLAAIGAVRPL